MVEGLTWPHMLPLLQHFFLTWFTSCLSCSCWVSHQDLLFYAFTLIATGLSQSLVIFHISSFILYLWMMGWLVLGGVVTFNTKVRSWSKLNMFSDMTLAMNMGKWKWTWRCMHERAWAWHMSASVSTCERAAITCLLLFTLTQTISLGILKASTS